MYHLEDPLFQSIFNQLAEPRLIVKADAPFFTLVAGNQSWQSLAQSDINQLPGKKLSDIAELLVGDGKLRELVSEILAACIQSKETVKLSPYQVPGNNNPDNVKWLQLECTPVAHQSGGKVAYLICTCYDVTREVTDKETLQVFKQNETELLHEQQALNEELAAANEELSAINEELVQSQDSLSQINEELESRIEERTRALSESEMHFRSLFEQSPIGMCFLQGEELVIERINEPMLQMWGRKREDVIGLPHDVARPELLGQPVHTWLKEVYENGVTRVNNELKLNLYDHNGLREAYVNSIYYPLKDSEGNVTALIIILQEITEWIQARRLAERTQEQLNQAIESARLGTWFIDTSTRRFVASTRLKELFGYHADDDLTYEQCLAQIPEDYRDKTGAEIEAAIEQGGEYVMEYPVIGYHDGKLRWIRATGKRYDDASGNPGHFSGTALDITSHKLEEIRKNDFIAIASHELKTPLTSLKAYLQVMNAKVKQLADDSFFSGVLSKSLNQVSKMQGLIQGFLDVARLESGMLRLNPDTFSLNQLIMESAEEASVLSEAHQIKVSPLENVRIKADRDKIGQVLNNLLSNAIKYSPKGKQIAVDCRLNSNEVVTTITDEGMGIKPEDIEHLFDRFYRVDSQHTKTISGFGIGLFLCAEIVRLHGGRIWVESQSGKGSAFHFSLPLTS
jgi:two-component system sensor histidine kinase VicK